MVCNLAKPENAKPKVISTGLQANRGARLCAVQALYQIELTGLAGKKIVKEFKSFRISVDIQTTDKIFADADFFEKLVKNVVEDHIMLDAQIKNRLAQGWTVERLDPIVRAALRCAAFELLNCLDIPVAVIIDEYVGVVAAFYEGSEAAFVNGLLDRLAKETKADLVREAP